MPLITTRLHLQHCAHGFPLGPSCMTFDPHRKCLFIGTSTGELRMYVMCKLMHIFMSSNFSA